MVHRQLKGIHSLGRQKVKLFRKMWKQQKKSIETAAFCWGDQEKDKAQALTALSLENILEGIRKVLKDVYIKLLTMYPQGSNKIQLIFGDEPSRVQAALGQNCGSRNYGNVSKHKNLLWMKISQIS
eukprot:TRINITY_DN3510_c0_g2_i1.p3 TRINITY_DN3510_c0_g2~~TRINITY_DN3510_c0_g2_i1.p3  ORF type:complete len:126 (-),score=3.97 TRINITY_DN3510_c0_g2_i1:165-542(-)